MAARRYEKISLVRCTRKIFFKHEKRNFVSPNDHVFSLYNIRNTQYFWRFSEDSPKPVRRPDERLWTFSKNFRRSPNIVEDLWRRSKDVLIIHQQIYEQLLDKNDVKMISRVDNMDILAFWVIVFNH